MTYKIKLTINEPYQCQNRKEKSNTTKHTIARRRIPSTLQRKSFACIPKNPVFPVIEESRIEAGLSRDLGFTAGIKSARKCFRSAYCSKFPGIPWDPDLQLTELKLFIIIPFCVSSLLFLYDRLWLFFLEYVACYCMYVCSIMRLFFKYVPSNKS